MTHIPDEADMRAFGASDAACVLWPEDTQEHRACRAAYIRGAADCLPAPMLSGAPCPGCGRVPGPNEHAAAAEDGKIYHLFCIPPKTAPALGQGEGKLAAGLYKAEVARLRTQLSAMRKALEFYAKEWQGNADGDLTEPHLTRTWQEPTEALMNDAGNKARVALATDAGNPTAHHKTGGE